MNKTISIYMLVLLSFALSYGQDTLQDVKVQTRIKSLQKSIKTTTNTTLVTSKELLKAACCNLAESFETNPSIDVSFSDAITGNKQIKMLGLTSPYLMITEENIPSVRGASQAYGLSFTPGTWVESIQITKGAGSVTNGFESISGQINTELLKPLNDIPFFLNVYGSSDSRWEVNTHFNHKISPNWASSLFIHGNARLAKNDMNADGFLDNPLGKQLNVLNRWQYTNAVKGWVSFTNFRFMDDQKQTGQLAFDTKKDKGSNAIWGSEINTKRFSVSNKTGYIFKDIPYQSIGFQNAFDSHNQESYFGLKQYNIKQTSYYGNLIFNSIISNTMHKFTTGITLASDSYQEQVNTTKYNRNDTSLGSFFEYTFDNTSNFSFIAGLRADNHNRLGFFITPRLHARYTPWSKGVLRFSAGRGKRTANIFAENQSIFASAREIVIENSNGKTYGLNPEIAWNYGLSFNQGFTILGKKADVGVDFYKTSFQSQVLVDVYSPAILPQNHQVLFYNLAGQSVTNSYQAEFNIELVHHLDLRTAYKMYKNKIDYTSGQSQMPLQAKNRFFANLAFETHIGEKGKQWKFDCTYNWIGSQKLPETFGNPTQDALPKFSKAYSLINAQITRTFSSVFEVYTGLENLGNYQQPKAILGAENPFGTTFDASISYAPVFGQMFYAGLRYKIK